MSDQVWWYATRAAGLMTWSTAVASVIVGLLLSTRAIKSRTGPWMLDLHRFLGGISVLFLVVHVATLPFDSFVDFGPRELFIPGESTWNPEAAAWGIIAAYALILVELTSLLRKHLSASVWRTFHMLSIVTAVAGTYHAILGGSDVDNPLTWLVAGAGSAIVVALVAIRLKGADSAGSSRGSKANDREALLLEMQERLENLPIAADVPLAEVTLEGGALPRREPVPTTIPTGPAPGSFDLPTATPTTPEPFADPFAANANPFAAPIGEPTPPTTSKPHDPFVAAPPASYDDIAAGHRVADPFGRGRGESASAPAPTTPPPGHDPFAATPVTESFAPEPASSPFAAAPAEVQPAGETPIPPTPAPFLDAADLPSSAPASNPFSTPTPEEPIAEPAAPFATDPLPAPAVDPFAPATPPQADPFAASAPAPAPSPTASPPPPPPVPNAVDPVTGEPDQEAYTTWLVEWLAYAEKYGEEAPGDPSRAL